MTNTWTIEFPALFEVPTTYLPPPLAPEAEEELEDACGPAPCSTVDGGDGAGGGN
jgi:hypothetical protein